MSKDTFDAGLFASCF